MNHPDASAAFEAALVAYGESAWPRARSLALEALRLDPQHPGALFLLGALELDAGEAAPALEKLSRAAALAPGHPGIRRSLAQAYAALGDWAQSAGAYREALRLSPSDAGLLAEFGLALHESEDFEGALAAFQESLMLDPSKASVYSNLAVTLNRKHDFEGAITAYERARSLDPGNVAVLANLAMLYEQMNELEKAEEVVAAGLLLDPDHDILHLVAARCERRCGDLQQAVSRLKRTLDNPRTDKRARRGLHFELGRDHDLLGTIDEAYDHFLAGNRIADELWPDMAEAGARYVEQLDTELGELDAATLQALADARRGVEPGARSPVFLVSFPRSGTTLMDTILGAHPDVAVMEEEPPLHLVQERVQARHGAGPRALLKLSEANLAELRALYWAEAARYVGGDFDSTRVIVDKNPFHSVHAALIHRLFPDARFVFAERHPCAVILSCFMQPFGRNPALANFTSLMGGAELYKRVMELWLRYRAALPLQVHALRYESLVDDKETELRKTLDYLGLAWDATLADHVAHARKRGRIYTPSYHQVSRPIYRESLDRWRSYQAYFGEASQVLRPFVDEFGYEP